MENEVIQESGRSYALGQEVTTDLLAELLPNQVIYVDPAFVSVERDFNIRDFKARENREHVDKLAALIERQGVTSPLRVRVQDGRIVITDGETRLRASLQVREKKGESLVPTVPVLLSDEADGAQRTVQLITRNTGKAPTQLEQLTAVKRLVAEGYAPKDVQSELGFSRVHYGNLMILDRATPAIADLIRDGWLSATYVIDELHDAKTPEEITAVEKKLVRAVEREKAKGSEKVTKSKVTGKDARTERGNGVIFNRGTFNALAVAMQDAYALMTPAKEYTKLRRILRNALENAGLPTARDVEPGAAEEAPEE